MERMGKTAQTLELAKRTSVPSQPQRDSLSFQYDARGELLLSWSGGDRSTYVACEGNWQEPLQFECQDFLFPLVQRFADGRWLVVGRRRSGTDRNARIFSTDLDLLNEFRLNDATEQVIVDPNDEIWVGFHDENPLGLRKFSDKGDLIYDFNASSGHNIFDLYAMDLDAEGNIWVYPYTDFYLARISNEDVEIVIESCPVKGAKAILVGGGHVAFFGNYKDDRVLLHDIEAQKGTWFDLTVDGKPIGRTLIATRGGTAALLWQDGIYCVTLADLIKASNR